MSEQDLEESEHEDNSDLALPGQRLKRSREELRLSRDEVAHHLHLDVKIIDALEANAFDKLPSPAYICGYLRSYARLLKLPENDVVNSYSKGEEINASLIPDNIKISPERHLNPENFKMVFIIIAIIVIAAVLLWAVDEFKLLDTSRRTESSIIQMITPGENESPVRPAQIQKQIEQFNSEHPGSMPIVETEKLGPDIITEENEVLIGASNDQENMSSEPDFETSINDDVTESVTSGDLKLIFNKESWTEVTDSNGIRHIYRLVAKDNELIVNGAAPYTILLGDADGVKIIYQDNEFNHKPYHREQIAYFRLGVAAE
ncbi:hypothetical protein MNBD_GAMMA21-545 [hydrothermal vent metagenome]|uniref:Cytoskeleton protein RodZ-like C-terminal domain-containing protein n=1 Tax=hydrothermal vent metagenome TaxID=652676 RepID=A0A3B1A2W6_9ZZZZ